MPSPRILPLPDAEADEYQAAILAPFAPEQRLNIFSTLVRHTKLFRDWLPFGGRLLYGGLLPARDRELLILSTSARCDAAYEWGQHVAIARTAGLSDDQIVACASGVGEADLDGFDATLHRAAHQLIDNHRLDETTWNALSAHYDERQCIEVTMLVGHYAMLAGTLNSLDVEPDGPLPAIGSAS